MVVRVPSFSIQTAFDGLWECHEKCTQYVVRINVIFKHNVTFSITFSMTFSIWKMISHPLCFAPDCPSSLTFPVLTHYKQTSTYLYQLIQTESTHLAPGTHPFLACSPTITSPPKNSHHPQEASTHPHPPIEHLQQVSTAVHAQVCHPAISTWPNITHHQSTPYSNSNMCLQSSSTLSSCPYSYYRTGGIDVHPHNSLPRKIGRIRCHVNP